MERRKEKGGRGRLKQEETNKKERRRKGGKEDRKEGERDRGRKTTLRKIMKLHQNSP